MAIPVDVQAALDRLNGGYNNGDYNASTNPLGFSNGGHRINLYALTADMSLVGEWANDLVTPIAGITDDIAAVAGIVADVSAVADALANIAVVVDNILAIQGASDNATAAAAARDAAEGFAAAGKHLSLFWAYSTTLTDANPGAGVFRLNNASPDLATVLFISLTEDEGGDATAWLDSWDDSTTTANRGTITLVSAADPGVWAKYRVTGANTTATGYRKVALAHQASAGTFGPGDAFGFAFSPTGDRGSDGLGAGTVTDSGAATENHFAAFADSSGTVIEDSGVGVADLIAKANNGSDFADAKATLDNLTKIGVNIASAATLDLDAASGIALSITGTTATSTITLGAGKWRLVRAAGAWPITVGANLVLNNGGSDYVCAAGDKILFVSEGATVRGIVFPISGVMPGAVSSVTGGNGLAVNSAAPSAPVISLAAIFAQCRLVIDSPNIKLAPVNGNLLTIAGTVRVIPDAGVTLAPTGLTVGSLYYIYASWNGSAIVLEASTTGYVISTTAGSKGQAVKSGDVSKALVGMVRPTTGPAFTDVEYQRFVVSFYNRRRRSGRNWTTANIAKTATTPSELNSGARLEFLAWAGDVVPVGLKTSAYKAETGATFTSAGLDGTTSIDVPVQIDNPSASNWINASQTAPTDPLSEGYHYVTPLGWVSGGTGNWIGSNTAGAARTTISAIFDI